MRVRTLAVAAALVLGTSGTAAAQMHHSCPMDAVAAPLLSTPDVDGDGTVTHVDLVTVTNQAISGNYEAIMDADASGAVDWGDVVVAAHAIGENSTTFDQQLIAVWNATKKYKNLDTAIADGYRPFTQPLAGHGFHYARVPFRVTASGLDTSYENVLDGNVVITEPEGLNYDQNGDLAAVFYYHGIDVFDWVFATDRTMLVMQAMMMSLHMPMPDVFASHHQNWHQHFGACFDGLDYVAASFNPTLTPYFTQPLTQMQCYMMAAQSQGTSQPKLGWIPAFNMMHLWLYRLNPCGEFANTHPDVTPDAEPEPHVQTFEDWYEAQFGAPAPDHDGH